MNSRPGTHFSRWYPDFVPGEPTLNSLKELAELRLAELLPDVSFNPSDLHQAMHYSATAPGKRLRPSLCMAAAVAAGGQAKNGLDAGCATELVHCFSLIHDDLPCIDDDELRRGRPTCHVKFGEAIAVLAGDALFALAFEVMSRCHEDASIALKCTQELAKSSGSSGLVGGEVLDIQAEGKPGTLDELKTIHSRKTGALIAACCTIGGLCGGGTNSDIQALMEYGDHVGIAFQIADDILNETSTAEQLGKAVGSDRERNKLTYPALIGLEESKIKAREATQNAIACLAPLSGDTSLLKTLAEYAISRDS